MNRIIGIILTTGLFLLNLTLSNVNAQDKFDIVKYNTTDGGKIEAAYFDAGTGKVVIFAHGAVFNKESWYFLAEKFQKIGISSLCIDFRGYGNSTAADLKQKKYDILGAILFLKGKGFKEIDIVGASMGGAIVLTALNHIPESQISKVVLLAPAGGSPMNSKAMQKLIVVSKDERLYKRVQSIYKESTKPKMFKEFEGSTHAQHMFKTVYGYELTNLIIEFIKD